jgi:hypothetical protein
MAITNEAQQTKISLMLGVEDINDFLFEDIMGGEPIKWVISSIRHILTFS